MVTKDGSKMSKSKGNTTNMAQIMGCLGQQEIAIRQEDGQYRKQRILVPRKNFTT